MKQDSCLSRLHKSNETFGRGSRWTLELKMPRLCFATGRVRANTGASRNFGHNVVLFWSQNIAQNVEQ